MSDTLTVEFKTHKRLTEAVVTLADGAGIITVVRAALRSEGDVNFPAVGQRIAYGRALQELGAIIEADAHAMTVTKEEFARVRNLLDSRACECGLDH